VYIDRHFLLGITILRSRTAAGVASPIRPSPTAFIAFTATDERLHVQLVVIAFTGIVVLRM
jgi:hypothetical protein